MAASQAYKAKIIIDSHECSNLFRSFDIAFNLANEDVTTFDTDGWTESIKTLNSAEGSGDILRKGEKLSYQNIVDTILTSSDGMHNVAFMPDGNYVGAQAIIAPFFQSQHTLGAPVSGVVGGQVSFQNNGKVYLGTVLHSSEGDTEFTGLL